MVGVFHIIEFTHGVLRTNIKNKWYNTHKNMIIFEFMKDIIKWKLR